MTLAEQVADDICMDLLVTASGKKANKKTIHPYLVKHIKKLLIALTEILEAKMNHVCFTKSVCGQPLCEALHTFSTTIRTGRKRLN